MTKHADGTPAADASIDALECERTRAKCRMEIMEKMEAIAKKLSQRWPVILISSAALAVACAALSLALFLFLQNRSAFTAADQDFAAKYATLKSDFDMYKTRHDLVEKSVAKTDEKLDAVAKDIGEIKVALVRMEGRLPAHPVDVPVRKE